MFSQSHLVLPFLGFPFRGKMDQAPISDPLKTPLSTWASVLDQILLRLYLVQALLTWPLPWAVVLRVYGSSTLASQATLPSFLVWFGFTEPLSLSSQDQESSLWEAISGPPAPGCVLPPLCIKQPHIECSVFWALSLGSEGHRTRPHPLLHCGCLSIHAVHLSLPRLEPPLPHLALGGVCLPRAALMVPVSFLSLLPLFCVFSAPPPGAKKKEGGERSS